MEHEFDIVIRGGKVIDGTGSPAFLADVGICRDQIRTVGDLSKVTAGMVIPADNRIVAPGFIDVHNHSDGWMLRLPQIESKTRQGFSTEVLMADGLGYAPVNQQNARDWMFYLRTLNGLRVPDYTGWETVTEFLDPLDGGNCQNAAFHLPYANIRSLVSGFGRAGLDDFQQRAVVNEIQRGMESGAVGLSTGLDYIVECFAPTAELVHACRAMKNSDGLYVTHVRYKTGVMAGVREAVEIGRRSGVRVHISHLKAQAPDQVDELLEYIDSEARHQVDFSFDVYPYQRSSTMLNYLLPYDVWEDGPLAAVSRLQDTGFRARFERGLVDFRLPLDQLFIGWVASAELQHLSGLSLEQFVADSGKSVADAILDLLIDAGLAVLLVLRDGDDTLVEPFLTHDLHMLATDGILVNDGCPHPRQYGSTGRFLGQLVRDRKLMPLETAISKLTDWPARRFGLCGRGRIASGYAADVVVFDPAAITGPADYGTPSQWTTGIDNLLVNGKPVLDPDGPIAFADDAALRRSLPGRLLRKGDSV